MRQIALSELVLDFNLYPREVINQHHVREMAEADKAGAEFPPYVADKRSLRVVDGFHRHDKDKRLHGPNHLVQVVEKTYRSERDMVLDAIRLNANHGRALNSYDKTRAILLARNRGANDKVIAAALNITIERVDSLVATKSAIAPDAKLRKKGVDPDAKVRKKSMDDYVPIKQTISHMAGQRLTKAQVEAVKKLGGMNQLFYVNQLILLIEQNMLDTANEDLMKGLGKLQKLLGKLLL
jgi:hypothetical protein